MEQSPIDLTAATMASIDDASLTYTPAAATVTDNGHTVQVNLTNAGSAVVDGNEYQLAQFHFHAPSEHTVDGVHSPVEAHFVHKDAAGNLAVIGVMIIEGDANPLFDEVIANIPAAGEEAALADAGRRPHADAREPDGVPLRRLAHDPAVQRGRHVVGAPAADHVEPGAGDGARRPLRRTEQPPGPAAELPRAADRRHARLTPPTAPWTATSSA